MKKLKIGMVAEHIIGYNLDGAHLQLLRLFEGLKRKGIDVELFDMWRCREKKYSFFHLFGINYSLERFTSIISSYKIPYIVSPNSWPGHSWWLQRVLAGIKLPRGILFSRRSLERDILLGAKKIIVNSKGEIDRLSLVYGIQKTKFVFIPNAVDSQFQFGDPEIFRKKFSLPKRFVLSVSYVGQPGKNHLRLIRCWNRNFPTLVLVGPIAPGKYSENCKTEANRLGNVVFTGRIQHESALLKSAYKGCSAFVLPSLAETTGIAALEAAISGAPVVITERGGTREYFDNKAFYCNPFKSESILTAVKQALNAGRDENRGQYFAHKYNWDNVIPMLLNIYHEVMGSIDE